MLSERAMVKAKPKTGLRATEHETPNSTVRANISVKPIP